MHNAKGSPQKLGRPPAGTSRHPTSGECVVCGLRRGDVIAAGEGGVLVILRWKPGGERESLPLLEHYMAIEDLEEYWRR